MPVDVGDPQLQVLNAKFREECDTLIAHWETLFSKHPGAVAIVCGTTVEFPFKSEVDAVSRGYVRFKDRPFMCVRVTELPFCGFIAWAYPTGYSRQ